MPAQDPAAATKVDGDAVGATVGAIAISRADLLAETDRHLPFRFHTRTDSVQMLAARKAALAALIEKALVFQDAQARGLDASATEIEAEFARALQKAGPEFAKVDGAARQQLLEQHRPQVVRRILLDKNEARMRAAVPPVTDAMAEVRYEARRSEMLTPARAHLQHLLVKVPPEASQLEVDRLLAKARQARADIVAGKPFGEVARAVSEDIYAQQGGDVGVVERGAMRYREIEAAAFALTPGQLSDVLTSMFGFHVVLCVAVEPPRSLTLAEALPMLRERLAAELQDAARAQWLLGLRQRFAVVIVAADWQGLVP